MNQNQRETLSWPYGGGTLGALVRSFDWSATSVGQVATWPQSLKTAADLVLRTPSAAVLFWGADGVAIYNDAYARFAVGLHTPSLGGAARDGWLEHSAFSAEALRSCLAGEAVVGAEREVVRTRNGVPRSVWCEVEYTPVLDERARPAGVLARLTETTARVLAERALRAGERRDDALPGERRDNALAAAQAARAEAEAGRDRLRQIIDEMPVCVAVLHGPEHVFELLNPAWVAVAGRRRSAGRPYREVYPELEGQGLFELLDKVYRTGEAAYLPEVRVVYDPSQTGALEEHFFTTAR